MNDIFAPIYETLFGLYDPKFDLIFSTLYNGGGYIKIGLIFILIPLIMWALFYFAWRNPYGKYWYWLLWLLFSCIVVFGVTWGVANTEIFASNNQNLIDALADPNTGYEQYASSLPIKYAMINTGLAIIIGFIFSLILKQFSKIQMHLPF
jgi:hypothetical protein